MSIEILYEQGPCLVINKPAGVLTQAPIGIDSLETRVKEFLKTRRQITHNVYLGVPHRLDRPVSGAIVLALHQRAARRLSEQFEGRLVKKTYWALVEGPVDPASGTWTDHVRKIPDVARCEVVPETHPEGRIARLSYRTLETTPLGSLLEIELETGRMHQIRLQAASRGWCVVGDSQYGSTTALGEPAPNATVAAELPEPSEQPEPRDTRLAPIALHARTLGFRHPMTQELVEVTAPLPAYWSTLGLASV